MNDKIAPTTVLQEEDGMRLDRWFKMHYPDLKFGQFQKLLRSGQIRLDGGRVKASARVEMGQAVRVPPSVIKGVGGDGKAAQPAKAKFISAKDRDFLKGLILHRDDRILVINKPNGLAVQGGTGQTRHLDDMLDGLKFKAASRPRLVHRLDKDTSGVLILARDRLAAAHMQNELKGRKTHKVYWALMSGVPRPLDGEVENRIEKSGPKGAEMMNEAEDKKDGGVRAITRYQVIDQAGEQFAWTAMQPITGRTHQLRVHASLMECPIVGDGKYGGRKAHPGGEISPKLHLHAHSISFNHPDGHRVWVEAPLPEHMLQTWAMLGFDVDGFVDPFEDE